MSPLPLIYTLDLPEATPSNNVLKGMHFLGLHEDAAHLANHGSGGHAKGKQRTARPFGALLPHD